MRILSYSGMTVVSLSLAFGLAACAMSDEGATVQQDDQVQRAYAELVDESGAGVGRVEFATVDGGVSVEIEVQGLPEGRHGFHIHEVGTCEAPDFTSSGGHFNPTGKEHGMENPRGPHAGDLPNIVIRTDGSGSLSLINPYLALGSGAENDLLAGQGTSVMIHAGPDDYITDPAGDSGARIACGVITPHD